jgi:6-phosphofructokinase 2
MTDIVTLTMNPAVDLSTSVERVVSEHKLRCSPARRDAGGGGINVARVASRLGADVKALYPRGGETGALLRRLIDARRALPVCRCMWPATPAKTSPSSRKIAASSSASCFRAPKLSEAEWRQCLAAITALKGRPALFRRQRQLAAGRSDRLLRPGRQLRQGLRRQGDR